MRTLFILAFVLMQFGAMAADVPPQEVEKSFKAKYPTATDVDWFDEEDGTYSAFFYVNEQSKTAKFTVTGSWTETKAFIDMGGLPKAVTKSLNEKFSGSSINGASMIESPSELNQFEVHTEFNGATYMLTFDEKGQLLKKLEEVKESDDADDNDASDDDDE